MNFLTRKTIRMFWQFDKSGFTQGCETECSCSASERDYVIEHVKNVQSSEQCKNLCFLNLDCNFYTFYDEQSALANTCHLFRQCSLQCKCEGCVSGPPDCSSTCRLPQTRGDGVWYCHGFNTTVTQGQQILMNERCFYRCGDRALEMLTCLSRDWDTDVSSDPSRFSCSAGEQSLTNSTWLPFIIGAVCGVVTISSIVTFFLLFRVYRDQKKDNRTHHIKSDSLGMETPA